MTNVVKFPGAKIVLLTPVPATVQPVGKENDPFILKFVWVMVALLWPILKSVVSIDCVVQLLRTMYYWHTAGVHAGWTFALHFAACKRRYETASIWRRLPIVAILPRFGGPSFFVESVLWVGQGRRFVRRSLRFSEQSRLAPPVSRLRPIAVVPDYSAPSLQKFRRSV